MKKFMAKTPQTIVLAPLGDDLFRANIWTCDGCRSMSKLSHKSRDRISLSDNTIPLIVRDKALQDGDVCFQCGKRRDG